MENSVLNKNNDNLSNIEKEKEQSKSYMTEFHNLMVESSQRFNLQNENSINLLFNSLIESLEKALLDPKATNSDRDKAENYLKSFEYDIVSNYDILIRLALKRNLPRKTFLTLIVHLKNTLKVVNKKKNVEGKFLVMNAVSIIDMLLSGEVYESLLTNFCEMINQLLSYKAILKDSHLSFNILLYLQEKLKTINANYYKNFCYIVLNIILSNAVNVKNFGLCFVVITEMYGEMLKKLFAEINITNYLVEIMSIINNSNQKESLISYIFGIKSVNDYSHSERNEEQEYALLKHLLSFLKDEELLELKGKFLKVKLLMDTITLVLDQTYKVLNESRKKNPKSNFLQMNIGLVYQNIFPLIVEFLNFSFLDNKRMYFNSGIEAIDRMFNVPLGKAYQIVSIVTNSSTEYFVNEYKEFNISSLIKSLARNSILSLIETCNSNFDYIVNSAVEISSNPICSYSFVTYYKLMFLTRVLKFNFIQEDFKNDNKKILVSIILPFIVERKYLSLFKITDNNIATDDDTEKNFLSNVDDLFGEQSSKSVRCVCAYTLQEFCDVFKDEFVEFVMKFCVETILFSMNNIAKTNIAIFNLVDLSQYSEDFFFSKLSNEERIETCLLILAIINQSIKITNSITDIFSKSISILLPALFEFNDQLVICRILTFIKLFGLNYTSGNLSLEIFDFAYKIVFMGNNPNVLNVVVLSAIDCITYVFENNTTIIKSHIELKKVTESYMEKMFQEFDQIQGVGILEILCEILSNFDPNIDLVIKLFMKVCEKIVNNLSSVTRVKYKKQSKSEELQNQKNSKLIKWFNIIRIICEKPYYILNAYNSIEAGLEPIFNDLKSVSKLEFDEDMIIICSSLINITKTVSPLTIKIVSNLKGILSKMNYLSTHLSELINLIIIYGGDSINNNQDFFKLCIKIYDVEDNESFNYNGLTSALIIQVLLTNNSNIPEDVVAKLINKSIVLMENCIGDKLLAVINSDYNDNIQDVINQNKKKLGQNPMNKYYSKLLKVLEDREIYSYIGYLTTLYSAFIYYPLVVFNELVNRNYFKSIFDLTEMFLCNGYIPGYQIKLISLGICSWLQNESVLQNYPNIINPISSLLVKLLIKQQKIEAKRLKRKRQATKYNRLKIDFVSEDDNSDIEESYKNNINSKKLITQKTKDIYSEELLINNDSFKKNPEQRVLVGTFDFEEDDDVEENNQLGKSHREDIILDAEDKTLTREEVLEIITRIESPLKNTDEFVIFKQTINKLKNSGFSEELVKWYNEYSDTAKKIIDDLNKTKRVSITSISDKDSRVIGELPRKVYRLKRKGNF